VTLRGNRRQALFHDTGDRHFWQRLLTKAMSRYGARLHLYCWMTNHMHMVLQCGATPIFKTLHLAAGEYARLFNAKYGLVGHLFQDRYGSRLIDTDDYLLQLVRYIHLNPVAAGLVSVPAEYRWSSYRWYTSTESPAWLTTTFMLELFSDDLPTARMRMTAFTNAADPAVAPTTDPPTNFNAKVRQLENNSLELTAAPTNLDQLIAVASRRFEVSASMMTGTSRRRDITKARAWTAWIAQRHGLATLTDVARRFDRHPSAFGRSIRLYEAEFNRALN
jgi:REP element-mobilizing transposase RayT